MRRRSASVDWATAYHEAGHAVVAFYFGMLRKRGATILPSDGCAGKVHTRFRRSDTGEIEVNGRVQLQCEKHAIVSLAGILAQRKYRPSSVRSYHGTTDFTNAVNWLSSAAGSDEEVEVWLRLLEIRTKNLLAVWWPRVEALAAALMERRQLPGDEIRQVIARE